MKGRKSLVSAMFVVALVLGSWIGARAQEEVTLLAMGPMRGPTEKVVANFEAQTRYKVRITYGNGVGTRRMVARGEVQDVSLITAPFPGAMGSERIIPSSATPIATVLTAVAVKKGAPKPDISTAAAVKRALLAAKAVGFEDPDFASSGQGPWQALNNLGIADQVLAKAYVNCGPGCGGISPTATANVASLTKRIEDGDIDIELNMLSDLLIQQPEKYDIVGVLPREVCIPDPIVGVISTRARDHAGAKALLQYMASAEAQVIWKAAGYGAPN